MGVPGEPTSDATASVADTLRQALASLDLEAVRRSYRDQNEFVYFGLRAVFRQSRRATTTKIRVSQ